MKNAEGGGSVRFRLTSIRLNNFFFVLSLMDEPQVAVKSKMTSRGTGGWGRVDGGWWVTMVTTSQPLESRRKGGGWWEGGGGGVKCAFSRRR